MEENETSNLAETERQTARKWYRWLWFSPLLTIPTLLFLSSATYSLTYDLICPQGWQNCSYDYAIHYKLRWSLAIVGSALWHLILLIPARNKDSTFVRWHGRQAMILAGVRTAVPLACIVTFNSELYALLSILILIPIWLFGTLWGQRQATRGDCSLMRWKGREESLPGPPVESEQVQDFSPETLVNIIRFSEDPEQRRKALAELKKNGLVETLDGVTIPNKTLNSSEGVTEKKYSRRWILGISIVGGILVFAIIMWGIYQYQEVIRPEPTEISLTANDFSSDGNFHRRNSEYEEAVNDYRKAIALDPDHASALNNLAWTLAYHLDTNYEEALDYAIRSVAIDPDASNHDTLALVYFKLENYESALKHYNIALSMDPNQDSSYKGRGDVHLSIGDYGSAEVDYKRFLTLDPNAIDRNEIEKKIDSLEEE
jgi:tetratricopeptide (TPR) repeat protein